MSTPSGPEQPGFENLPEPPFDELYDLYVTSLAYDRKRMMRDVSDNSDLEERIGKGLQPVSKERFAEHLKELDTLGGRAWFVNQLVLGPEYCDAHPNDPRIQQPAAYEQHDDKECSGEMRKAFRDMFRNPPNLPGGGRRGNNPWNR
jgi:hypothetical protein